MRPDEPGERRHDGRRVRDALRTDALLAELVRRTPALRAATSGGATIWDAWLAAVERVAPRYAEHCRVAGIRKGEVTVDVDDPARLNELQGFRREELLAALREEWTAGPVDRIRFRLAEEPAPAPVEPARMPRTEDEEDA